MKTRYSSRRYEITQLEPRQLLASISWDGGGDGVNWNDPANWSADSLPTPTDDVVIDAPGDPEIRIASIYPQVRTLETNNRVYLNGFELSVLNGAVFNSDVKIDNGGTLRAANGLTLNGNVSLISLGFTYSTLRLEGSTPQTISGTGSITNVGTGTSKIINFTKVTNSQTGLSLTFGPDVEIHTGQFFRFENEYSNGMFINRGTIDVSAPANVSTVVIGEDGSLTNYGTIDIQNAASVDLRTFSNMPGGTLNATNSTVIFEDDWTNGGTFTSTNTVLFFGGTFTREDFGDFTRVGGSITVKDGMLDNTGHTFTLDAIDGDWTFDNGGIQGGIIDNAGPGKIITKNAFFDGVVLNSDLAIAPNGKLQIQRDLELNATLTLGGPTPNTNGRLFFSGSLPQTLHGNGSIVDATSGSGEATISNDIYIPSGDQDRVLTIEQGIEISLTGNGSLSGETGWIMNYAPITYIGNGDLSSGGAIFRTYSFAPITIVDAYVRAIQTVIQPGVVFSATDSILTLTDDGGSGNIDWNNNGILILENTTLNLGGDFYYEDLGDYTRSGGTVNLIGDLQNIDLTLTLNDHTGDWNLCEEGSIRLGTLAAEGDHRLFAQNGSLYGVTIEAPIQVFDGFVLKINQNAVLNDVITLGNATNNTNGTLEFRGEQESLSGTGSVNHVGTGIAAVRNYLTGPNSIVTIGSGIDFNLGAKSIFTNNGGGRYINEGELRFNGQGSSSSDIDIGNAGTSARLINNGLMEFKNAARAEVLGLSGNLNQLIIQDAGTRVLLNGTYSLNQLTLVPIGATLALKGSWTRTASMDIAGTVIFDHGNDNNATYNAIGAAIQSGYNNGTWDGPGLRDPLALTNPGTTLVRAKSSELLGGSGGTFNGIAVDSTSVIVRHTLTADVNLDGTVGFNDLLIIAQHYGQSGVGFAYGDLNGDGTVDFNDLLLIAQNYGQSLFSARPILKSQPIQSTSHRSILI